MRSLGKTLGRLALIVLSVSPLLAASGWLLARLPGTHATGMATAAQGSMTWLIFLAYGWTGIFVHEAGHALAGTMLGFRLSLFRVAPLEVVVESNGRARWGWHTRLGGGYIGLPKHGRNLPLRTLLVTAGGPLANLFTFLFCWLLLRIASDSATGTGFAYLRGLMTFSLFSTVINLAPFEFGASKTDGRRLWEALIPQIGAKRPARMADPVAYPAA